MHRLSIKQVCDEVSTAAARVDDVFHLGLQTYDILDRFWALEDTLRRLVEANSDHRHDTREILERDYSELIGEITQILHAAEHDCVGKIAAVRHACETSGEALKRISYPETRAASPGRA